MFKRQSNTIHTVFVFTNFVSILYEYTSIYVHTKIPTKIFLKNVHIY